MVVLYCALLLAAGEPVPPRAVQRATMSVTILRPHRASAESWDPLARRDQKEIVKKERDGTTILLRLTEFE
jgi:hypothetical protein